MFVCVFVCDYKPLKTESKCVILVSGDDTFDYNAYVGAPVASLLETKVLINSVISDAKEGAKYEF